MMDGMILKRKVSQPEFCSKVNHFIGFQFGLFKLILSKEILSHLN